MRKIKDYVRLMRVHHYIKNFLIFTALVCSGQFFHWEKLLTALTGFGAFCAASSAVYIINDIRDQEKDRRHPTKQKRPVASGRVPVKNAWILTAVLLAAAALCNIYALHTVSSLLLALYLVLNLAYSFGLKNVPLVDVAILVSGFLLRVMYGAVVTEIAISNWLYLTVIALAFYFSLGKRRNELKQEGSGTRKVLEYYTVAFLDKNMYLCLTLAVAFYALWCMDGDTVSRYGGGTIFTVPIVLLIVMKYSMSVEGDSDGDPVEVLLRDKVLLLLCAAFFSVMFMVLYL